LPGERVLNIGRRFARVATNVVVRRPRLWPLLRPLLRFQFDWLAPHWDGLRDPNALVVLERGLTEVETPRRVLDLGTGTGVAAFALAERFPTAEIVGVDLSPEMVEEARRKTPGELGRRITFTVADAAHLPFPDGDFDLVTLNNMIPFFDELARVVGADGSALVAFSSGAETPIYVPIERLRAELARRGFTQFAEFAAGSGSALLARRPARV
jgi:SAM-dependent methyltransferase